MPKKFSDPMASGYSDAGASYEKRSLRAFTARSLSAVEDIDFNNSTLRQRARMLYMASPIAAAAINTNRTKIVGKGLRLKCNIDYETLGISPEAAKKWCKHTEAEFRWWCEDRRKCDALGMNNFFELQGIACKAWQMSGDVFVVMKREKADQLNPYTLRLHLIEADRVCTPAVVNGGLWGVTEGEHDGHKIHDGVEVDDSGKAVAYHICNIYPGQMTANTEDWVRIEAVGAKTGLPNILHIMDAERPDQYRGVTYLSSAIEMILQLRRYVESEQMAALVQTYLTAWIKTGTDSTEMPIIGEREGEDAEEDRYDEEPQMAPGNVIHLKPGEDIFLGNPNIPTAGFEAFSKTIIKQIGAGLEMPYDVLVKEFNSSYSASKGALEEAWEAVKMRRAWFVSDFCQPVYEVWLAEAVALGRIKAPGFFNDPLIRAAWCGSRWDGPAQTHLDPKKEAEANIMLVQNGWKTNEQITREYYGENWEENMRRLEQENELKNKVCPPAAQISITSDRKEDDDAEND